MGNKDPWLNTYPEALEDNRLFGADHLENHRGEVLNICDRRDIRVYAGDKGCRLSKSLHSYLEPADVRSDDLCPLYPPALLPCSFAFYFVGQASLTLDLGCECALVSLGESWDFVGLAKRRPASCELVGRNLPHALVESEDDGRCSFR